MKAIDIARKLAQLEQGEDACRAYTLSLQENNGQDPALDMEAALYILEHEGDYKISYTCFRNLYNQGCFREDTLSIMTQAFYQPNEENDPVISRNFFKDLEKPILAEDVYSQYELEYLCDTIRKSEYVGRENHLYLHYTDWACFCAHLQCLNIGRLLREKKPVFLAEDEISQYPIDFKERFGIDYSRYPLRMLQIREIHRLIWHTQLSTHNGGDFFNEIFDGHPNLLFYPSLLLSNMEEVVEKIKEDIESVRDLQGLRRKFYTAS